MAWSEIIAAALALFFIMDPLGNVPVITALLKHMSAKQRARVVMRESLFALFILLGFNFVGAWVMKFLGLSQPSLSISGGILLFVIALRMVFPDKDKQVETTSDDSLLLVPIAMPMIAGPSALAVVMMQSAEANLGTSVGALVVALAWVPGTLILATSSFVADKLGKSTINALEKLMGMLLILLAIQMLLNGFEIYVQGLMS